MVTRTHLDTGPSRCSMASTPSPYYKFPSVFIRKGNSIVAINSFSKTKAAKAQRKLTKEEWDDLRSLATTVTSYDPAKSPIKGQTTVQILNHVQKHLDNKEYAEVRELLNVLILREAYNAFIGVEGAKRRRN